MLIIAVDDERLLLNDIMTAIREAEPEAQLMGFTRPTEVIREVAENGLRPDAAFLDIELPGVSGIELAKLLKKYAPKVNIIFVTGFSDYAVDAADMYASGYVMKPAQALRIKRELDNLRYPIIEKPEIRLLARTFGSFEAFVDGEPLRFKYAKTKELFAYLIDRRGAAQNTAELCSVLWEDGLNKPVLRSHLRNLISDLTSALRDKGQEEAFIKSRNSFSVNTAMIDCDLYRFLAGDRQAINSFGGEYMSQYAWGEVTIGELEGRRY